MATKTKKTTAAKKSTAKKAAAKKTPAKKTSKTVAKKAPAKKAAKSKIDRSAAKVSAAGRREALLKLLLKLKATSDMKAVENNTLAKKLGYTNYDVYCLCYHKYPLVTSGFVVQVAHEGTRQLSYYITAKGKQSLAK